MLVLTVNDLSLSFGDKTILNKVAFALEESDKLGVIGVNGCGKTSLLRMLTGEVEPTSGTFYVAKGKTMAIVTQDGALRHFKDLDESTPLEQMYGVFSRFLAMEERMHALMEEINKHPSSQLLNAERAREYAELEQSYTRDGGHEFRSRCVSMLKNLGFSEEDMNRPIRILSGGQRTRLALGLQMARDPDILLLDEPTNHLDIATTAWLENYLVNRNKCVIVVSHDRYFLDRVTNKTLAIQYGAAKLYNGNYTRTLQQRAQDRETARKHYEQQQKEIARQEAYIAQQRAWNRQRNIVAAESRQKMLDKMVLLEKPKEDPKSIRLAFTQGLESGNDVLIVRDLGMRFGERSLFSHLSFLVKKAERVLIIGANGCGKSTLIKMLIHRLSPTEGSVLHGTNVEIGYYDQENQNLDESRTVLEELWNAYPTLSETEIRSTLASFRFTGDDVFKSVRMLSGGERARLTLSKLILSRMNLLVLDEPTNHLDIDSREALEEALAHFDGTIVAVSHDRYFIDKLATRILEIRPDEAFGKDLMDYPVVHPGQGYTEYIRYCEARLAEMGVQGGGRRDAGKAAKESTNKENYLRSKQEASEARKRATRISRLQAQAKELEDRLEAIETELNGDAATDYVRAAELDTERTQKEALLLQTYAELEELDQL